jgi:arylsulfatase A-like enzyme
MTGDKKVSRRELLQWMALLAVSTSDISAAIPRDWIHPIQRSNGPANLPNFLILLFDTFSARHLSFLGYPRLTTPNLARYAERAVVFHAHTATGNFTMPATASLLTGTYPWTHGGYHLFGMVREPYVQRNLFSELADDYWITTFTHNAIVTGLFDQFQASIDQVVPSRDLALLSLPLADRFFSHDFVSSFWGERILRASGRELPGSLFLSFLDQEIWPSALEDLNRRFGKEYPRGLPTNLYGLFFLLEPAIDWLLERLLQLEAPYLAYCHLFPPHEPYTTRKDFVDIFDDGWAPASKPVLAFPQNISEEELLKSRRLYDEYIAFVDAEFGRLLDGLDRSGVLENTYVIVTADHGQLFERQIHGHATSTLYEPLVHIPLLILPPANLAHAPAARQDVYQRTSSVDLLPTLLHLAGKPLPDWMDGKVLPPFRVENSENSRAIYAVEAKRNPNSAPLQTATVAMFQERYKLISYFGYASKKDSTELYDLENDPEEVENLAPVRGRLAQELNAEAFAAVETANRRFAERTS